MNGPERVNEPARVSGAERQRPGGRGVQELSAADVHAAGSALALAFETDPHMQWIFHDTARRLARLQRMWTMLIERAWLERGSCHILEYQAGACIWLPPDDWQMSLAAQARTVLPLAASIRDGLRRLLWVHFFNDHKHPREPAHWYLATIGVAPAWQGRGYGQALLEPVLRRCDQDRVPAYLEATSPRNRAFYERNGFEAIERCTYARGAITTWRMWREPTSSHDQPTAARTPYFT